MKEIYKPVVGYEQYYLVSNLGNIKSIPRKVKNNTNNGYRLVKETILSQKTKKNGYKEVALNVNMKQRSRYVHRLVAEAFIGDIKKGFNVNHKDGDRANNNLLNLEIVTYSENIIHSYRFLNRKRTKLSGTDHPSAKFNNDEILKIRELYKSGEMIKNIHKNYYPQVGYSTIGRICRGEVYTHIF